MFIISNHDSPGEYLIYDNGYKWADIDTLKLLSSNSTKEHPFIFAERGDAWAVLHLLNLQVWTRVIDIGSTV